MKTTKNNPIAAKSTLRATHRRCAVSTGWASRDAYHAGYRTQRQGSFFRPNPHPESVELAAAWDQGYKHAEYNERHGLQHLHLPNVAGEARASKNSQHEKAR